MATITVGVDLAKQIFSVCEVDVRGAVRGRHDLRLKHFALWLAQLSAVMGDLGVWSNR